MRYEWTSSVSGVPIWNMPVGDDGDANAWAAAVVANGGTIPTASRLRTVGTLVQGLKATGVWAKLDRLWLLAAADEIAARTDLVARVLASKTGSPVFTTDRGYDGEDSQTPVNFLNTLSPLTALSHYSLNSGHLSAWVLTNLATSTASEGANMGVANGSGDSAKLFVTFSDGNVYPNINDQTAVSAGAPPTRIGHWIANRVVSTNVQVYRNGNSFADLSITSTAVPSGNPIILASNNAGLARAGNLNRHAAVSIGGGLAASELAAFYGYLRDYMNAVGIP